MSVIQLVLILCAIGVLLYLFNKYVTAIEPNIKQLINIVILVAAVLIVLAAFGIFGLLDVQVPRLGR